MKKQLFFLVIINLVFISANLAQYPFSLGSAGQEYGKAITVDNAGNVVAVVLFQNTIDFDPGAGSTTIGTPPGVDCAIAKYSPQGNLIFAKHLSGTAASPGTVVTPHGVQTDAQNNIYVIGYFGLAGGAPATVDFDPNAGVASLTNSGGWDPFVAKYDSNGNYLWARTIGNSTTSTSDERSWDLAVDAAGNVYFTGFLSGTYDLDGTTATQNYTSAGGTDAFLGKYDANGNFAWAFGLGGAGDDEGFSVAVGNNGEVFLQGDFSGTVDMNPGAGSFNLTSAGGTDIFLSKFDANGNFQTAVKIGGTLPDSTPPGTMRTDASGNIYFSGRFRGTVDLDTGAGVFNIVNNSTSDNLFVATYTAAFGFRWGFSVASDGSLDGGHRVVVDNQGNILVTGWFCGNADFDGGAGTFNLTSNGTNGASDVFLAKYNSNGGFLWARQFGAAVSGDTNFSIAAGLAVDSTGNSYITGQFYGAADFDPSANQRILTSVGANDGFLAKYDANGNLATNAPRRAVADFDGDGKTDISIFRPSFAEWWYMKSSNGGNYATQFGNSTDKLVPGDYTGDGKADIAVWRPVSGEWFILRSEDGSYYSFPFGTNGDIPAVGDFDGDGKADQAIFRPSDTNWYIRRSSDGGFTIQQFGANNDTPVVADYDGDGKSDIAIWRGSVGQWWIQRSSAGIIAFQFGNSADKPVQGDYTGDGKADVAIWRPSTGEWFILRSENQSYYSFPFGTNGDVSAPGDYDGDGKFDATVFRPSSSTWYVQRTTAGTLIQSFGQNGDLPVPNAFVPQENKLDITVKIL